MSALLTASVVLLAVHGEAVAPARDSWALFQGLHRSARIEFHVPPGPTERAARRLEEAIARRTPFEAATNPESFDSRAVRVLVGDATDDQLAPLVERCGVEFLADGFRFAGRDYRSAGDALCAVLEDPEHSDRPLCLFLGNDLEALAAYMTEVPRLSRPALTVWADGDPAVQVSLEPSGAPRDDLVDLLAARERLFAGAPREVLRGVELVAPDLPRERWVEYARRLVPAWKRVEDWLSASETGPPTDDSGQPVEVFVYTRLDDLRAALGTAALAVVNRLHPRVHVLMQEGLLDDDGQGLLLARARMIAGEPAEPWVAQGLPVAATGRWWGQPLKAWCGRGSATLAFPGLVQLQAPDAARHVDPLLLGPARGLAITVLAEARQGALLRGLWNGAQLPSSASGALQASEIRLRSSFLESSGHAVARRKEVLAAPPRRGLALPLEPGAPFSSAELGRALDDLVTIAPGPDAVALTVYTSDEEAAPPLVRLEGDGVIGRADDVELAAAVSAARARGLRVLLTLEPLSGPRGAWADVRAFNGLDAQAAFWERFERLAVHHALLAQLADVEILALGSNLREASRTSPSGEVREPRLFEARSKGWRRLIALAHGAFDGPLTYVARFPSEANEIDFWDQLDMVAVAFYPQLALPGVEPGDDQVRRLLRQALSDALDLAIVWNRPLLVAQTGFPARSASWNWPAAGAGEHDPLPQLRFLERLAEVLEGPLPDREMLRGLWLWSWPISETVRPGARAAQDYWLNRPGLADVLARLLAH